MSHVDNLIKIGILIDPNAVNRIEKLTEEELNFLIKKIKEERPLVLTESLIENIVKSVKFKVIKNFKSVNSYGLQDFVSLLNQRYSFLRDILVKKIELKDAVSINKCSNGKASVIGLVRNKTEKDNILFVELEDPTGTLQSSLSKNIWDKLLLDDVIAISGNFSNKVLVAENVFYPDVSIKEVKYSKNPVSVGLLADYDLKYLLKVDVDFLFALNCRNLEVLQKNQPSLNIFVIAEEERSEGKFHYVTDPSLIEIDDVIFLISFEKNPLDAIRRRYIHKSNNDFLIDHSPDIVFSESTDSNYKGISIISKNRKINLKDRSVEDIF